MPSLSLLRSAIPLALIAALLAGCGEQNTQAQGAPPAPTVTVAKPTKKLVSDRDEYVGRFIAFDYVEVRARVSGYLDKIHFKDGQLVKAGDPLFLDRPAPVPGDARAGEGCRGAGEGQSRLCRERSETR